MVRILLDFWVQTFSFQGFNKYKTFIIFKLFNVFTFSPVLTCSYFTSTSDTFKVSEILSVLLF